MLVSKNFLALCVIAGACLGLDFIVHAQQPIKIRIAWAVTPAQIAPIMLEPPGVTRHNGKSYILEPIRFPGSAQTLQAIGAGEVEVANMAFKCSARPYSMPA